MFNQILFIFLLKFSSQFDPKFTEIFVNDGDVLHNDTICEIEPRPNCGTGKCFPNTKSKKGFLCECPPGHSQSNSFSPCEGVYIGSFGAEHPCTDGLSSDDITAINSRTLKIDNFHCDTDSVNCNRHLQYVYFIAHMGTRDIHLKTVHFDKCTGTALPGIFPATLYLEFPEDWYVEAMYKLSLHDMDHESSICYVKTTRKIRDKLESLDHPNELKCHYHGKRVLLGRFGAKEKCQGHIHTEEIDAVNSRIIKVNRFHCDGDVVKCHELLEGAFFVAKRGKNSVFLKPIVHDVCSGFTLPQFQFSFSVFLELPDHWTVDSLSSFLLWDFNTKRILCRLKIDDEHRRLAALLPIAKKSRCKWEHESLHDDL